MLAFTVAVTCVSSTHSVTNVTRTDTCSPNQTAAYLPDRGILLVAGNVRRIPCSYDELAFECRSYGTRSSSYIHRVSQRRNVRLQTTAAADVVSPRRLRKSSVRRRCPSTDSETRSSLALIYNTTSYQTRTIGISYTDQSSPSNWQQDYRGKTALSTIVCMQVFPDQRRKSSFNRFSTDYKN